MVGGVLGNPYDMPPHDERQQECHGRIYAQAALMKRGGTKEKRKKSGQRKTPETRGRKSV